MAGPRQRGRAKRTREKRERDKQAGRGGFGKKGGENKQGIVNLLASKVPPNNKITPPHKNLGIETLATPTFTDQKYKSMLDLPTSREDYPFYYSDVATPNQAELNRYYQLHPEMTDIPVNERGLPDLDFQDATIEFDAFENLFGHQEIDPWSDYHFGIVRPEEGIMSGRSITPEQMYMWGLARKAMGYEV